MCVDWQFPLDLNVVQRDHQFLDDDSLHALFRRLTILNRTAKLRGDSRTRPQVFDFAAIFIFPSVVGWRPISDEDPISLDGLRTCLTDDIAFWLILFSERSITRQLAPAFDLFCHRYAKLISRLLVSARCVCSGR